MSIRGWFTAIRFTINTMRGKNSKGISPVFGKMEGLTFTLKEKASILEDIDFELELIHRDVINVQYILALLAQLYDADETEGQTLRKLVLDSVAGDIELRSKCEMIEKFIDSSMLISSRR